MAPNHTKHADIDVLHLCRNDWMKRIKKQINTNLKVVQMIQKDVLKIRIDVCWLKIRKDSGETDSVGSENWFRQMRSVARIQHYSIIALFEV